MHCSRIVQALSLIVILGLAIVAMPSHPVVAATAGTISVDPPSGPVDTIVNVSGSGFTPGTSYAVKFGTSTVKTGVTDGSGNFATTFIIPTRAGSRYPVTVATDAADTSDTQYFTITPEIELDSTSGRVGDQFTVSGTGFRASSSVSIYFDGTVNVGSATTSSDGTFDNASAVVPATYRGNHTVTGRDASGTSPGVTFQVLQNVSVAPTSGGVGDRVTVSGTGFASNSDMTFSLDREAVSGTTKTNASGSFTYNAFVIPPTERGNHTILAKDASGNSAGADFTIGQKMTINPTTGSAGGTVTVTGSGFRGSKPIAIKYGDNAVETEPPQINTDSQGSFSATFKVPAGKAGSYVIEAKDGSYAASATFVAIFEASMYPSSVGSDALAKATSQAISEAAPGYVGMELTITGTGFKPNAKIAITGTSESLQLASATTDALGAFSVTFAMPGLKSGRHQITATDGANTKQFAFVMESQAPAVPTPQLPKTESRAKRPVQVGWKEVEDKSGVTYTLQIAKEDDFASIVLEKTGLTKADYTLTEEENLESVTKQNPYYWRVKAIDGASNESAWSVPSSFHVGFVITLPDGSPTVTLPAWVLYAILLGFLLSMVGGFGFFLGKRRRASYWDKLDSHPVSLDVVRRPTEGLLTDGWETRLLPRKDKES